MLSITKLGGAGPQRREELREDGGGVRGHVDGHRLLAGLAVAARAPDDGRNLIRADLGHLRLEMT